MFDKKLTIVHLFEKNLTKLGHLQIMDKCWTKLGQILDIRPKFVQHLSGHPFYKSTALSTFEVCATVELDSI